jgi:hypothetical protein
MYRMLIKLVAVVVGMIFDCCIVGFIGFGVLGFIRLATRAFPSFLWLSLNIINK